MTPKEQRGWDFVSGLALIALGGVAFLGLVLGLAGVGHDPGTAAALSLLVLAFIAANFLDDADE